MRSARRAARQAALQALYAWQLGGGDPGEELRVPQDAPRGDAAFAAVLARGVRERAGELETLLTPHLDRAFPRLSPVERAILLIAAFELVAHPETPFKVVINEAVELGKSFGAAEGHRFVNGVLEKVALAVRPDEVARARKIA